MRRLTATRQGCACGILIATIVFACIDPPNSAANRRWMKLFKERWKKKLDQLELWMVSYLITVE